MAADERYRPDIEGLRAFAILGVVLYHVGVPGFGGGFVGVDLFFVLSGFLITGLLLREHERSGRIHLAAFWARRVRRLLPAACMVLIAIAVGGLFVIAPLDRRDAGFSIDSASLYAANWFFVRHKLDYLAMSGSPSPVLHYWSLGVEEQFYLLWPLLMVWLSARGGDAKAVRRRLFAGIALVGALSLMASIVLTRGWQPVAFYGSPTRFWQLGVGAMLAVAGSRAAPRSRSIANGLASAGIALLLVAVVGMRELAALGFGYPGALALMPTVGTALVVTAGATGWFGERVLGSAPLRFIGRLSYSWYLWHWPLLQLARPDANTSERLGLALAALVLAWLTHHLIENPVRFSRILVGHPARSLALGLVLTLASLAAGELLRHNDVARIENRALKGSPPPFEPRFSRARDDLPVLYSDGCHLTVEQTVSPPCVFADATAAKTVMLLGDSHATELFPALERAAADAGWRVVTRVKSDCSPSDVVQWLGDRQQAYERCSTWRSAVLAEIEAKPPDVVVVATIESDKPEILVDGAPAEGEQARKAWSDGLVRTLRRLKATGADVLYIRDNAHAPQSALKCASWTPTDPSRCDFDRSVSELGELGLRAAQQVPGARTLDMTDAVCDAKTCHLVRNGIFVFRDATHLTATFSRSLAPRIAEAIRQNQN